MSRGEYFWVDIARDGIVIYELPGSALATPQPLTAADAYEMARAHFANWLSKIDTALEGAAFYMSKGHNKDAAFTLHQATERAYICYLFVRTLYFPRSHNAKFLRSLAEDSEPQLIDAWCMDNPGMKATARDSTNFPWATSQIHDTGHILGCFAMNANLLSSPSQSRLRLSLICRAPP